VVVGAWAWALLRGVALGWVSKAGVVDYVLLETRLW